MHYRIKLFPLKKRDQAIPVSQVKIYKFSYPRINRAAVPGNQGIQHCNIVPAVKQIFSTNTADVTGTASNEDLLHIKTPDLLQLHRFGFFAADKGTGVLFQVVDQIIYILNCAVQLLDKLHNIR